ncbi:hypothetical protein LG290_06295 [Halomonas sediminis]|uniref:SMODS and SLOG-associating 2TM effector domain-containing protein n=1 Tax=Vreelandella zhuhanensis TaxID=2684210 RepID=A0A7X3KNS3_9GAMM|nr:hypothetical protein [Halomonas zhuhanensis]MWJ26729.1 hypothetical protein [Halomonas zhuhanensis]
MDPIRLRFEVMRDLYQSQRDRREQIRSSVATPVSAMAFTVFNLSTLATHLNLENWSYPANMAISIMFFISIVLLLSGAILIVRLERSFIYVDPPDLEELVSAEKILRYSENSDEAVAGQLQEMMSGSYDIVYRWYFAANEQAARDRTHGLHLILFSLIIIVISYAFLPFQM